MGVESTKIIYNTMEQKHLKNEYCGLRAGEKPKQLTSIEEFIWNGAYTINLLVDDKSLGLPFEFEGEEVVHLVVKDQTREGNNQNDRVIVQTLTRVNRVTGHVLTYTRTRRYEDGKHRWGEWGDIGGAGAIGQKQQTDTIANIQPNVLYVWGEVTELDITLMPPTNPSIVNEYMIQFTSGEVATTLILPSEIKWMSTPIIQANKVYQISIVNNLAVMGEFGNE